MPDALSRVDHLAYASRDLDTGVARLQSLLGVRATPGGAHPGWGTRNALLALGERRYLEIIGVDPDQPIPERRRPLDVDDAVEPRLSTWAAVVNDLERVANHARERGFDLGPLMSGSRRRADGILLRWTTTDIWAPRLDGMLPFLIDWNDTPHPASVAARGCSLVSLRAEHPEADRLRDGLAALGIPMEVSVGEQAALVATIDSPRGRIELR
jgi:hypothetical protein